MEINMSKKTEKQKADQRNRTKQNYIKKYERLIMENPGHRERILEKAKNVDGDLIDGICVHILMENKWFVRLIQALTNSNETTKK